MTFEQLVLKLQLWVRMPPAIQCMTILFNLDIHVALFAHKDPAQSPSFKSSRPKTSQPLSMQTAFCLSLELARQVPGT